MVEAAVLRTERLLLRPFREGDVDDVYAFANGAEWSRLSDDYGLLREEWEQARGR
jgi:RimJ/RimL family protein N-acetyltransferase